MNATFDVLIIGGGVVGLTAALAMSQRGYTVAIIDAGSLTADITVGDMRVYAINQASQNFLEQIGAWELDPLRISPYRRMYVWDALSGAHIDFDSRSVAAPNLGTIIEESVLKHALLAQIANVPSIHLFPHSSIEAIKNSVLGITVSSEKQIWEGTLLMVADGANSSTRQKLNVTLSSWSYQQHALVATVAVEKTHQQTAYQVFNPEGPLAFLPLADPHQCSIVWSIDSLKAKQLMELPEEEFNEALTQAFAKKLGQVKIISSRHQFPLHMRHVTQYSGDHWLILGDAAHTIHPLAGLGLNLGLDDVRSWIECLDAGKGALVSKKTLSAYQRNRKHAVWQVIALMEGFKRLFCNSFMPAVTLRGLGLMVCNKVTPLKRLFIEHARGT